MCLLVALHEVHPDAPLIVAANRDELLARDATAMTVLDEGPPRVLGGRDHLAGGTWLAINERPLVAGLTNRPSRERSKAPRSRGEWPLFLSRFDSAAEAAGAFTAEIDPQEYNPGWVLAGDGRRLFYVDMTGETAEAVELEPGVHILENRALGAPSPKVDLVRERLRGIGSARGDGLIERLRTLLASHEVPAGASSRQGSGERPVRPPAARAACVHLGAYATRSSTLVLAAPGETPRVWSSDGPPCTAPLVEVSGLWTAVPAAEEAAGG